MTTHKPPCPGPQAHITRHGKQSCTGHRSPRQGPERAGRWARVWRWLETRPDWIADLGNED